MAVILVILAHVGLPGTAGGFIGVDVFFTLSGFLITTLLLREVDRRGRVGLIGFYARRARRILPAATTVLGATTLYAAYLLPRARAEHVSHDAVWSAFFGANIHFGREGTAYFALDSVPSPLRHFWSLAVEEQFYLVWPTVLAVTVLLVRGRSRAAAGCVVALACLTSLAVSAVLTHRDPVGSYFATTARVWELGLGVMLALASSRLTRLPALMQTALGPAGLGLIGFATFGFSAESYDLVQAAAATTGTMAVLVAGAGGQRGIGRLLEVQPAVRVGDLSYSLYLWHWPVLVLGGAYASGPASPSARAALLTLVGGLSLVSYELVERPFRSRRRVWSRPAPVLLLWPTAVAVTLAATSWSGHIVAATRAAEAQVARDYYRNVDLRPQVVDLRPVVAADHVRRSLELAGVHAPLPLPLRNLEGLDRDDWERHYPCHADYEQTSLAGCDLGAPTSRVIAVAVGDSHVGMWLPALDAMGRRWGIRVVPFVKYSCPGYADEPMLAARPYQACTQFRSWVRGQIRRLRPRLVILGGWALGDADRWRRPVAEAVRAVAAPGRHVVVIGDATTLPEDPGDCLTARRATMASCVFRRSARVRAANVVIRSAAEAAGAQYVDTAPLLCVDGRCPLVVNRIVTFRDDDHVSVTWARAVASEFGKAVGLRQLATR